MALQIRRGLAADLPASPADGELLYATDTNTLYVGDSGTAQEISGGGGGGGGGVANIVEDTTPQLGGNLDVNGFGIVSTNNSNITIDPNGTGSIVLHNALSINSGGNISKIGILNITPTTVLAIGRNDTLIDGNLSIIRNSHSNDYEQGFTFAQHHETVDAVHFNLVRSRGTALLPTAVQNGDDIGEMAFTGHDGTQRQIAGFMSVKVGGPVSTGIVPGELVFSLRNLAGSIAEKAKLTSEGIWKVNNLQNLSGTDLTLTATTVKVAGNFQLNAQGDLRFADSDSSNYLALQSPSTLVANVTWTLPGTDGTPGQVLSTNGSGILSWAANAGGSGLSARTDLGPITTSSLVDGASENLIIIGYKGYILYKIQTDAAAWVRLYSSTAARDADAGRLEGTDPLPGAGVIAEVITTGNQTVLITPGAIGFSTELTPDTNIPCTVTNKSGITTTISVTVTALQIEV